MMNLMPQCMSNARHKQIPSNRPLHKVHRYLAKLRLETTLQASPTIDIITNTLQGWNKTNRHSFNPGHEYSSRAKFASTVCYPQYLGTQPTHNRTRWCQ